jgi:hypothetical protein
MPPQVHGERAERFYVITRSDLSPGYVVTQAAHAVGEFCVRHPFMARGWKLAGGWLITLTVDDERSLETLAADLERCGVYVTRFFEDDLAGELTAISCLDARGVKELTGDLPLALRSMGGEPGQQARRRERCLRETARNSPTRGGGAT